MKAIRTLLACIRKADQTYNLINHGDKVIVGLSGGKDSMALLYCLNLYKKFSHTDFEIQPVTLDLGFPNFNPEPLKKFCASLGLNLIVQDSKEVYEILCIQQEKQGLKHLPCSICSRMKKASINKVANELGYNKVAFAHHADDAIETLLMNEIYGSRIATFSPKMHLENANIDFIRPFLLVHEKDIKQFIKEENIDVAGSSCPADKNTTREDIKNLLNDIYSKYPKAKQNFLSMISNYEQIDLWGDEIYLQVDQEGLTLKPVVSPIDEWQIINIRQKVFHDEQNVSFYDNEVYEEEISSKSFLIYYKKDIIGTIRYRLVGDFYKIERFAILKEYRNKGYGLKVINFLSDYIGSKFNPCVVSLNAQKPTIEFYKKAGYIPEGDFCLEAGIIHQKMVKKY